MENSERSKGTTNPFHIELLPVDQESLAEYAAVAFLNLVRLPDARELGFPPVEIDEEKA